MARSLSHWIHNHIGTKRFGLHGSRFGHFACNNYARAFCPQKHNERTTDRSSAKNKYVLPWEKSRYPDHMGCDSQWLSKSRKLKRNVLGQSNKRHRLDDDVFGKAALAL